VADSTSSALVKTPGLCLHYFRLASDRFDSQRPDQPHRFAVHEALHVFSTDQRDVLSKAPPIVIDQSPAMLILFSLHFLEDLSGCWIIDVQSRSEACVNARIRFL